MTIIKSTAIAMVTGEEDIAAIIARVKAATDFNGWSEGWIEVFRARGHEPALDEDGAVNKFAYSGPGHNGPACIKCGFAPCYHCLPVDQIPECTKPSVPGRPGERT